MCVSIKDATWTRVHLKTMPNIGAENAGNIFSALRFDNRQRMSERNRVIEHAVEDSKLEIPTYLDRSRRRSDALDVRLYGRGTKSSAAGLLPSYMRGTQHR